MYTTGLRRPGHEGRFSAQLIHLQRSARRSLGSRHSIQPAGLAGRWTVTEAGRLELQWSLTRSEFTHGIASEEAMPDQDEGRSPRPGALPRLDGRSP
jgi:hypothetical protein